MDNLDCNGKSRLQDINFQGADLGRAAISGTLCGPGAIELPGCLSGDGCRNWNGGQASGSGVVQNVVVRNIRLSDAVMRSEIAQMRGNCVSIGYWKPIEEPHKVVHTRRATHTTIDSNDRLERSNDCQPLDSSGVAGSLSEYWRGAGCRRAACACAPGVCVGRKASGQREGLALKHPNRQPRRDELKVMLMSRGTTEAINPVHSTVESSLWCCH